MIELWKAGDMYYPDKKDTKGKPVKFTEEDLQKIAMSTNQINLTNTHKGGVIGCLENFIVKEGTLYVNEPEGVDIKGLGISPVFDMGLVESEDGTYFKPYDLKLVEAGLVKDPRSHIYYNNTNGDGNLTNNEDLLKSIQANNEEIRSQREEIGTLKAKNKKLEEQLNERKELEKQLNDKNKEFDELQAKYDAGKSKIEAYDKYTTSQKEELIKELAGDDEKAVKEFSNMDIQQLKFIRNHKLVNTKPNGVANNGSGSSNGTDPKDDEPKDPTYDDYIKFAKENGIRRY